MATNIYYHFDSEAYSDLLNKIFSDRDISDEAINKLLIEVENTTNNVLSFEEEVNSDYEGIDCLSDEDNLVVNGLLSNPFLDIYFVNGNVDSVINGKSVNASDVSFQLAEKSNAGFSKLTQDGLGNTAIFVVDSRELAPFFEKNNNEGVTFASSYMYGYYDQQTEGIVKNLNFVSRPGYVSGDISYESYLGEYSLPIVSNNVVINELYKKLYSLEVLFGKYVDEKGFEDLKNQIRYYASMIVSLKQSISEDMVMDEARLSENYNEEFAL